MEKRRSSETTKQEEEEPLLLHHRKPLKKSMTTPEAIAELKQFCKQEDPCDIYTQMAKIGEGYCYFSP